VTVVKKKKKGREGKTAVHQKKKKEKFPWVAAYTRSRDGGKKGRKRGKRPATPEPTKKKRKKKDLNPARSAGRFEAAT